MRTLLVLTAMLFFHQAQAQNLDQSKELAKKAYYSVERAIKFKEGMIEAEEAGEVMTQDQVDQTVSVLCSQAENAIYHLQQIAALQNNAPAQIITSTRQSLERIQCEFESIADKPRSLYDIPFVDDSFYRAAANLQKYISQ